jgi:hypothetical protein
MTQSIPQNENLNQAPENQVRRTDQLSNFSIIYRLYGQDLMAASEIKIQKKETASRME